MTTKKLGLKLKVMTIPAGQFDEGLAQIKSLGYQFIDYTEHDGLVTLAYQAQYDIVEYNLRRESLDCLKWWAAQSNIELTTVKSVKVDMTQADVKALFSQEKEQAVLERNTDCFWEKWEKVCHAHIPSLFTREPKVRREILKSAGINPYKTARRKAAMTKGEIIQALLFSSPLAYEAFSGFLSSK